MPPEDRDLAYGEILVEHIWLVATEPVPELIQLLDPLIPPPPEIEICIGFYRFVAKCVKFLHYALCALPSAHSYRNASTGFASAALIACVLTVISAMSNAMPPASANTHQPMSMRYAKSCSQLFIVK